MSTRDSTEILIAAPPKIQNTFVVEDVLLCIASAIYQYIIILAASGGPPGP